MRSTKFINDDWIFTRGFDKAYTSEYQCGEMWQKVLLPHSYMLLPTNYIDKAHYLGVATYQRIIELSDIKDKRVVIVFEGVAHKAEIFVNGEYIGEHKGGYTAFEIDITKAVKEGENLLTVKTDSSEDMSIPPFGGVTDFLGYSGIYREVSVVVTDTTYISEVVIEATDYKNKILKLKVDTNKKVGASFAFRIYDGETKINEFFSPSYGALSITREIGMADAWTIDNPHMYTLKISASGNDFEDEVEIKFGFRKAEFTKDGFYLNDKRIKLVGLNRHQSYPMIGYAAPRLMQEADAMLLKSYGCNVVRTSHCPQSRHFLDCCDRIGLLVVTEIPGCRHIGFGSWQDILMQNLEEMIKQNRHHPSIVLWGVRINESEDNDLLYERTNKRAHELDATRQTMGVRNFGGSHLLEDVYAYNDYSHSGDNYGLITPNKITGDNAVPYLVTEHTGHMYPTRSEANIGRLREQALRHTKVVSSAYEDKRICGVIGWCMSDYNTSSDFGSESVCSHGVFDMFRNPKPSAYFYASQQDAKPILEVVGDGKFGGYDASEPKPLVIFSNCDEIKVYNDNILVDTLKPSKMFKHLPHPPFILETLGKGDVERIMQCSPKDGERITTIMLAAAKGGLTPVQKMEFNSLSKKYGKTLAEWKAIAEKVIYRRGMEDAFRLVGYKGGKEVISKELGYATRVDIRLIAPEKVELKDSYELVAVTAEAVSDKGLHCTYCDDTATFCVEGGKIEGNATARFNGGYATRYVRLTKTGDVTVSVARGDGYPEKKVVIKVLGKDFEQPMTIESGEIIKL